MNRRLFLAGLLAAPAIVRASSLMPIVVRKPLIVMEIGVFEGFRYFESPLLHDDLNITYEMGPTRSVQALTLARIRDITRNMPRLGDTIILRHAKILAEWNPKAN